MDDKKGYSDGVTERKHRAKSDLRLARRIESGEYRTRVFGKNWEWVDFNEVIARFAPGSKPVFEEGKIIYYNEERTIAVIADVGGGYLRILDMTATGKRRYLDIDGNNASNYTDERGKQHGRSKADYNAATHFRIKKREMMQR